MIIEVKKIWLGKYVSLRDYMVAEAMEKNDDILVKHGEDTMLIKHKDLHKGLEDTGQQISKFGGKNYRLIDFLWKPDKKKPQTEGQQGLFGGN